MIITVGTLGCGKTLLIKALAEPAGTVSKHVPTVPTQGCNIVAISRIVGEIEERVTVREIGGSMSPIWNSMVEPGRTQILYCVDSSDPMMIGAATISLIQLLHHPALQSSPFLIVFTKTDVKSARTLNEMKTLMRLEDIIMHSTQKIEIMEFTSEDKEKIEPILEWCMKFKTTPQQMMNGSAY